MKTYFNFTKHQLVHYMKKMNFLELQIIRNLRKVL
jgi:hypothetical protein